MERFYKRKAVEFQCEVVTPMFLGGANQEAEWRAAPFKAMLRYWWRVTKHGVAVQTALATEEGRLFGRAGDKDDSGKSLVGVFVQSNVNAVKDNLPECPVLVHPECIDLQKNPTGEVKPLLYLAGMGLSKPNLQVTRSYFPSGAKFALAVDYPSSIAKDVDQTLALVQAFGSVGGRSRNGWGSFQIVNPSVALEQAATYVNSSTQNWTNGLGRDYPNCLGMFDDGKFLLWKTQGYQHWKLAMRALAEAYIEVRAKTVGKDDKLNPGARKNQTVQERHLLGIPLTKHDYGRGDARHASPLRFVVKKQKDGFRGFILHMPHGHSKQQPLEKGVNTRAVWEKVHRKLNGLESLLLPATYKEVLS